MQWTSELSLALAELQRLKQVRALLSDSLSSHAARLKSTGALPPEDLLDELLNYRSGLSKLSAELTPTKSDAPLDSTIAPQLTLDAAQSVVDARVILQDCAETLARILRLSHVDNARCPWLTQCQFQASLTLQSLESGAAARPDTAALQRELPPFKALLSLIESADELSDAEWAANQELVTETWGRALSTAIARGKIRLLPEAIPPSEPAIATNVITTDLELKGNSYLPLCTVPTVPLMSESLSQDEPVAAPAIHSDAQDDQADIVHESQEDSVFDTAGEACTERSPSRSYRAADLKLLTDEPFQWARPQSLVVPRPHSTVQQVNSVALLAQRAKEADFRSRPAYLSPLIVQLLWEDHPVLAFYLSRGLNSHPVGHAYVPPTWLVHALTLCRHMCYSRGDIARQIEIDLEQFTPELLATPEREWDASHGFLLRAAALVPALLNASPAASRIIKSFHISPGLSCLYNYCVRILRYGQQLQGQAADLFTPDCDSNLWTCELEDLQQSISDWLPRTFNRYCAAAKTSPLFVHTHWTLMASTADRHSTVVRVWSKWQEVFRIVHRLLAPLRTANESERQWVRSEMERLTHAVRLESASQQADGSLPVGVLLFPDEQMVIVIREAMAFANRWLRLCASKPDQGRTLIGREAEILRDEILERTDGVIAELAAYSQTHPSTSIKASIACLCRTIEHLRMIFSPHSTLALREPAPQEILIGELLPIPRLELDSSGSPLMNTEQLEDALLNYLQEATLDPPQTASLQATLSDRRKSARGRSIDPAGEWTTARVFQSELRHRGQ